MKALLINGQSTVKQLVKNIKHFSIVLADFQTEKSQVRQQALSEIIMDLIQNQSDVIRPKNRNLAFEYNLADQSGKYHESMRIFVSSAFFITGSGHLDQRPINEAVNNWDEIREEFEAEIIRECPPYKAPEEVISAIATLGQGHAGLCTLAVDAALLNKWLTAEEVINWFGYSLAEATKEIAQAKYNQLVS